VLVVEDEPHAALVVARRLRREGFCVQVVLDVGSGTRDIPGAMRGLLSHGDLRVVMISPLGDAAQRIWGLGLGADDFVPGPLLAEELVGRVRCVLRRNRSSAPLPLPTPSPQAFVSCKDRVGCSKPVRGGRSGARLGTGTAVTPQLRSDNQSHGQPAPPPTRR